MRTRLFCRASKVRDGELNAGDYDYEPNGVLHGATEALEDTEYLFLCNGPVLFFEGDSLTGYLGWEELLRMTEAEQAGETLNLSAELRS